MKILMVEDSDDDVLLIAETLRAEGMEVDYKAVKTPAAVKESVSEEDWDAIITDHSLPGMDSFYVLAEVNKANVDSPVLIVSGAIGEEYAAQAIRSGAYDYVLKKNLRRLAPAIRNAIEHKQAQLREREMSEKLRTTNEQLRELAQRMGRAIEEERLRVSREIHDELGGNLAAIKMDVRWIQKHLTSSDKDNLIKLERIADVTDQTIRSMRRIISDLRPTILDDLGLLPAIEWLLEEVKKRSTLHVSFHVEGMDKIVLEKDEELSLFRIVQESITNIMKHSSASMLEMDVSVYGEMLSIFLHDNGGGLQQKEMSGYGILGMQERARGIGAKLEIIFSESGTDLKFEMPLQRRHFICQ